MQVVRSLVQKGVILSDKLSPDKLGTWLLHHHFFGQLVWTETERLQITPAGKKNQGHLSHYQYKKILCEPRWRYTACSCLRATSCCHQTCVAHNLTFVSKATHATFSSITVARLDNALLLRDTVFWSGLCESAMGKDASLQPFSLPLLRDQFDDLG